MNQARQKHRQIRRLRMRKQAEEARSSPINLTGVVATTRQMLYLIHQGNLLSIPATDREREH